jgi:hypothetical protein
MKKVFKWIGGLLIGLTSACGIFLFNYISQPKQRLGPQPKPAPIGFIPKKSLDNIYTITTLFNLFAI